MPAKITAEQLVQKVREQAQAHPDKVYKNESDNRKACAYAHSDEPGCIIGWALHDLGWSLEDLRTLDDRLNAGIRYIAESIVPGVDGGTVDWLEIVQDNQDNGGKWGVSVARADG